MTVESPCQILTLGKQKKKKKQSRGTQQNFLHYWKSTTEISRETFCNSWFSYPFNWKQVQLKKNHCFGALPLATTATAVCKTQRTPQPLPGRGLPTSCPYKRFSDLKTRSWWATARCRAQEHSLPISHLLFFMGLAVSQGNSAAFLLLPQ